jgi:hypothetical protein
LVNTRAGKTLRKTNAANQNARVINLLQSIWRDVARD